MTAYKLLRVSSRFFSFLSFTFSLFFYSNSAAQSCQNSPKSAPLTKSNNCIAAPGTGGFNYSAQDRIEAINSPSVQKKWRSVFVNQSINRVGGFAIIEPQGNGYYADPNEVGSTFAIDVDGDCIYEREDELLSNLKLNGFNEIILYNVSSILNDGENLLVDYTKTDIELFNNDMGIERSAEWHLARFIKKAKNWPGGGFEVVAVVPEEISNSDYEDRFYDFYLNYSKSPQNTYDSIVQAWGMDFFQPYIDTFLYYPDSLKYKRYGEDTLFLPLDTANRISTIDKSIVDMYNLTVFQRRVTSGAIGSQRSTHDPCDEVIEASCESGFDGHFFEVEWWRKDQTDPDGYLDLMRGFMLLAKQWSQITGNDCFYNLYVPQLNLHGDDWVDPGNFNRSAQDRANLVDELADRIYIYSYRNTPCDLYWGRATANVETRFRNIAAYFANNNLPVNNGGMVQTVIVPTFNSKYFDASVVADTDIPQFYGDGNIGCNSPTILACDWCNDYSGHPLQDLIANGEPRDHLAYIENIFQDQYDFDPSTAHPTQSENFIKGYCWFKSSLLQTNGHISSVEWFDNQAKVLYSKIYPNPNAQQQLELASDLLIEQVKIYSINGNLVLSKLIANKTYPVDISLLDAGVYIVELRLQNGKIDQHKLLKL